MRRLFASLALSVVAAGAGLAQTKAPVYCGSFTPITFRVTAGGQDPESRSIKAMEVINKYLGGKAPKVTAKPQGANIRLMIQKDVLATVTPADAKAEKAKSAKVLAASWTSKLNAALKESCAQK